MRHHDYAVLYSGFIHVDSSEVCVYIKPPLHGHIWIMFKRQSVTRSTHGHSFLPWRTFFSWVTLPNEAQQVINV